LCDPTTAIAELYGSYELIELKNPEKLQAVVREFGGLKFIGVPAPREEDHHEARKQDSRHYRGNSGIGLATAREFKGNAWVPNSWWTAA
jgi:hypothetical protein